MSVLARLWTIGRAPGLRHLSGAAGLTIIECIVALCLCESVYNAGTFTNKYLWCKRIADPCSYRLYGQDRIVSVTSIVQKVCWMVCSMHYAYGWTPQTWTYLDIVKCILDVHALLQDKRSGQQLQQSNYNHALIKPNVPNVFNRSLPKCTAICKNKEKLAGPTWLRLYM